MQRERLHVSLLLPPRAQIPNYLQTPIEAMDIDP